MERPGCPRWRGELEGVQAELSDAQRRLGPLSAAVIALSIVGGALLLCLAGAAVLLARGRRRRAVHADDCIETAQLLASP